MKKGFTLIELIAVLVILSLASLLTYSGITNMNKKTQAKEYENYKETLYMATESYIRLNDIEVSGTIYVDIDTLLTGNYLEELEIDPKTNEKEYNAKISVTKDSAGILIFDYINE